MKPGYVVGCLQLLDDGTSEVGRLVVATHVRRPVSAVHVRVRVRVSFLLPVEFECSPARDNNKAPNFAAAAAECQDEK